MPEEIESLLLQLEGLKQSIVRLNSKQLPSMTDIKLVLQQVKKIAEIQL